jgi:hypothetical protein
MNVHIARVVNQNFGTIVFCFRNKPKLEDMRKAWAEFKLPFHLPDDTREWMSTEIKKQIEAGDWTTSEKEVIEN